MIPNIGLMPIMIPKPIDDILIADLQALVDDGVRENKTIEYKRELPGNADSDKVRFLAAVSSFANTSGGDLIIGMVAEDGEPTAVPGADVPNLDAATLRLDHIIANGLELRLPHVDIRDIPTEGGRHAIVVRATDPSGPAQGANERRLERVMGGHDQPFPIDGIGT